MVVMLPTFGPKMLHIRIFSDFGYSFDVSLHVRNLSGDYKSDCIIGGCCHFHGKGA